MTRRLSKEHTLVRTGPRSVLPLATGIVDGPTLKVWFAFMVLLALGAVGIMIWMAVIFHHDQAYYCSAAVPEDVGDYWKYPARAAEPYAGPVTSVTTGVTSVDTCWNQCTDDTDCKFFTHDKGNQKCYFYNTSILPDQNAGAAPPGPTNLTTDVYVAKGQRVTQIAGQLK